MCVFSARRRVGALMLALFTMTLVFTGIPAASAADSVWQLSLTGESVPSGTAISYRVQLSCSAMAAPTCDDGEIRIPMPPETAAPAGMVTAGQEVTYTLTVTNTGDTELTDVMITDPVAGLGDLRCTVEDAAAPNGGIILVAGATAVCVGTAVRIDYRRVGQRELS